MSETVQMVNIDLSNMERKVSHVDKKIDNMASAIQNVEYGVAATNSRLEEVKNDLTAVSQELLALKNSFEDFVNEKRRADAMAIAATELVRVRQELEHEFGGYKNVRKNMLGVLQATDLALVKKNTISQVTEELMLATPDYWLAPCLIAVSAWIGNDRNLAERAIAEAVKRDEEKTSLTMALICRRNNRTDTCYEWLSRYFAKQSAMNFTASNFTYLNAYLNGVFGPDENHMCDDYVAKWMREIQENGEELERNQIEQWRKYCSDFTVDLEGQFPQLNHCVHEYREIEEYVSRINSVDKIADNFHQMQDVYVDQQKLKKDIDQTLVTLVSRYDAKEEPLRKEERYLMAIRHFDGDKEAAKAAIIEADRKKKEETVDLIGQMTNVIIRKENPRPSEKKAAVSFLSTYIRNGFENYITEKKSAFPQAITLNVDGWSGTTENKEVATLKSDFEKNLKERRMQELDGLKTKKPQMLKICSIILAVMGLAGFFASAALGIIGLIAAGVCFLTSMKISKNISEQAIAINDNYNRRISAGLQTIDNTITEWNQAQKIVKDFEAKKLPSIVA